jgi:hypothetical protein
VPIFFRGAEKFELPIPDDDLANDIFDADGEYTGTLPEDSPFPVVFPGDNRIGYVDTDSLYGQRLVVARIAR